MVMDMDITEIMMMLIGTTKPTAIAPITLIIMAITVLTIIATTDTTTKGITIMATKGITTMAIILKIMLAIMVKDMDTDTTIVALATITQQHP
jgi:hypothetical protein